MISACPPLDELEVVPLRARTRTHVDSCASCRLVLEAFSDELGVALCERFDALLAARGDGTLNDAGKNLLARHLAGCEPCRAVAETLSPSADRDGDHSKLPAVDPAAYALGLEVARGGMGRIIAARDLRVGRPVAVKELLGSSPQLAARFEREARVTARLQHPGIVPIYEIGRWPDGTPFYAMRMVEGSTLREAIAAAPTLAQRLALLTAVIAASEAISFAHAQRIIHRDLTPSNVLVGAYGETVVIDWGLAKDLVADEADEVVESDPYRTTEPTGLTNAGSVIGTVVYMPPEQAHATYVDERADVYALGAILYHLLAGVAPYEGGTSAELLAAVKHGAPRAIEEIVPTAPRDLVSIVTKAMARSPEARYPSARELTNELKRFQTGNLVDAHAYSSGERIARFVRRHRNAVVVTLSAAIIIAVVGAIAVTRTVRSRNEAKATARELLFEKGRVELLAGNPLESLAYLDAVATSGERTPALDFLINAAIRDAKPSSLVDCGGTVFSMALSPDGESLVAACGDHARIWRVRDRAPVASLGPFIDGFYGATYSVDGARLATWGRDGKLRVWNARDGTLDGTFEHGGQLTIATFSPRGDRVLTSGSDGFARVWDLASGKQLRELEATSSLLLRLVWARYSADGTHILTITIEGEGLGWDAEKTGPPLGGFRHGSLVVGGDLSRDGRLATSCGIDRITRVWNATTGAPVLSLAGHTDVVWKCVFDETGTRLLTTGHDGRANLWDLADGSLVTSVDHGDILWSGSLSRDGRRFATIGVDGRVKVWDARSGALLANHDSRRGKDAKFTSDGRALVVMRGDGQLEIWDETSTQPASYAPEVGGAILAVASDGSRTIVEDRAGWLSFVDLAAKLPAIGTRLHAPAALATTANTVAAISTDADKSSIAIVALATGATLTTLPIDATPQALAISADGARVAAIAERGSATVWDIAGKRAINRLEGARDVVLSGDGRRALAWHTDDASAIWDVDRGVQVVKLAIAGPRRSIGFSAAGDRVAILESPMDAAQVASIWNATTGELVVREPATSATIDPSGRWLTTVRADGHVTVSALADGHERTSFVAEHLLQAQVDRDGELVAAIGDHGRAAIVLATDGRVLARWPLEHAAPTVSQTGFRPPLATAAWSTDGTKIITHAKAVAVWHVSSDEAEPLSSVMRRVPWRIVNGRPVVLRDRHLAVRVLSKTEPVANARVSIQIRIAPDVGGADLHDWDAIRTRYTSRTVASAGDGTVVLDDLAPGSYTITVVGNGVTRTFEASVPVDPANDARLDVDLKR